MLHMIIEQTYKYPMRMKYNHETGEFTESGFKSLAYERNFTKPYGWIKESGTPPFPHWDCILMTNKEYDLGDEIEIKIIGVFKRADFDHKYVVVEATREIDDITELMAVEMNELNKLYPRVGEGEGWFGKEMAEYCMKNHNRMNALVRLLKQIDFSTLDIDELLDNRDAEVFDAEWIRVYNAIESLKNVENYSEMEKKSNSEVREQVFRMIYELSNNGDLAGYVSDELFEVHCEE